MNESEYPDESRPRPDVSHKAVRALAVLLGAGMAVMGTILNPWIVAHVFSPDGVLGPNTRLALYTGEAAFTGLGVIILLARNFLGRSPGLVAGVFGLALAAGFVCGVEFVFYKLNHRPRPAGPVQFEFSSTMNQPDPLLGYRAVPGAVITAVMKKDGTPIRKVTYTIDEHSRRVIPGQPPASPNGQFILYFGCSFTFGEWVNDDETLPYYVSQLAPGYHAYNFAYRGYGTQHMLSILRRPGFKSEIAEPQGTLIYVYMADHVPRVIGAMRKSTSWAADFPCYTLDRLGQVEYRGSFATGRPLIQTLYNIASQEQILQYYKVEWPLQMSRADYMLTARLVKASFEEFQSQFPGSKAVVALYPAYGGLGDRGPLREFKACLDKLAIPYLDYREAFILMRDGYVIPYGDHPNAEANRKVAEYIVRDLALDKPVQPR